MPINCRVKLLPKQALFMQSKKRCTVFVGGIGSGKTRIINYSALVGAMFGRRSAVISFSYRNLLDVVTYTMFEAFDAYGLEAYKHFLHHKVDNYFGILRQDGTPTKNNDGNFTQILMRSGDEPDRLRGLNLDDFYIDEAREFPNRDVFNIMIGRIREREDAQCKIGTSSLGKNWVYELIEEEGLTRAFKDGVAENENMLVIVQSTYENSFLPASYIADLTRRYTGAYKEQELFGSIVDFSAGVFERQWFQERDMYYKPVKGVRAWDLAASTETAADFNAGVLIAQKNGIYNVVDVIKKKATYPEMREVIINTAISDGRDVVIGVEQVGMQLALVQDLSTDTRLAGYTVKPHKPVGDKLTRALPLTSRFKLKTLRLCAGTWNDGYIDELCAFDGTNTSHDDQVDGTSSAWDLICKKPIFKALSKPAVVDDDILTRERYAAIEIVDFKAYIICGVWHSVIEVLEITEEFCADDIDTIADKIKDSKHRVGTPQLESDSFKSINQALIKKGCLVMTQAELDTVGAIYTANQMILKSAIGVNEESELYRELSGADSAEGLMPYTMCLLRIIQDIKSKKKPKEKVYGPFEKAREEAKAKQAAEIEGAEKSKDGWVG